MKITGSGRISAGGEGTGRKRSGVVESVRESDRDRAFEPMNVIAAFREEGRKHVGVRIYFCRAFCLSCRKERYGL